MKYAVTALVAALIGAASLIWILLGNIEELAQDNAALSLALDAATARNTNVKEDQKSDAEIDNLSNDDLRNIPNRWLLPGSPGGGIY